ncbi:hypothetical protein PTKIN_Ptkin13bG0225100 [Pterospermum kingtungense]
MVNSPDTHQCFILGENVTSAHIATDYADKSERYDQGSRLLDELCSDKMTLGIPCDLAFIRADGSKPGLDNGGLGTSLEVVFDAGDIQKRITQIQESSIKKDDCKDANLKRSRVEEDISQENENSNQLGAKKQKRADIDQVCAVPIQVQQGGLPMYVATRGLYGMKLPTIIVPTSIKEDVEKLFEVHRKMDQSELKHNLIGLDIGDELFLRRDLKVRAFKTYHVIPSQGYIVYSVKQKLKEEYFGLSGNEIKNLKLLGVEIMYTTTTPEIAFTGDTMSDFILDEANIDVLRAMILVVESTFIDNSVSVEHARDYGHIHLSEIINYADKLENRAILLIHSSARYALENIQEAVSSLPAPLAGRVFALTEGF